VDMATPSGGRRDLCEIYDRSDHLDAKWGVMRRFRVSAEPFEEWVIGQLDLAADGAALDVGAGAGRFSIPLARRLVAGRLDAIDASENVMKALVDTAKAEDLPVTVRVADVESCSLPAEGYDVIVAGHMIYHLRHPVVTLGKLRRALKPDGEFVATTNARVGMPELFGIWEQTCAVLGLPTPETGLAGDDTEFTSETGEHLLRQVFDTVRVEHYDGGFIVPHGAAVLTYFAATQLYRAPMRDESVPFQIRERIAPTFAALAQDAVDAAGGRLLVSKPMTAFICTLGSS
jgi:SAM-dependent methyltransferase